MDDGLTAFSAHSNETAPALPCVDCRYQMLELLGEGGAGAVYKAKDTVLARTVAIKLLHANLSDKLLRRFHQEAKAMCALVSDHVARCFDINVTAQGQPYMVMEYLQGRTLADYLAQNVAVSSKMFFELFLPICDALVEAHSKGIVHRDLKPQNIYLCDHHSGRLWPKILDFGIAKSMEQAVDLTRTGELFGSPLYMSPEQCKGQHVDERTDIYSVGCVMYQALTGVPPFEADTALAICMRHINDEPIPIRRREKSVSVALESLVLRTLAKHPKDRFQSMSEMRTALERTRSGKAVQMPFRARWRQQKIRLWALTAALVGLAILVMLAISARDSLEQALLSAAQKAEQARKLQIAGFEYQIAYKLAPLCRIETQKCVYEQSANFCMTNQRWADAVPVLKDLASLSGSELSLLAINHRLFDCAVHLNDYPAAKSYFEQCSVIYFRSTDKVPYLRLLSQWRDYLESIGNSEQAVQIMHKALECCSGRDLSRIAAENSYHLALTYSKGR